RDDVIGPFRHQDHVAGLRGLHDRTLVARLELAAAVEIERDLPVRDARIANLAFDAQATSQEIEHLALRFARPQLHGSSRARKAETDMNHIAASRQREGWRSPAILLDRSQRTLLDPARIDSPVQPARDHRQLAAEARAERERGMSGR